MKRRRTLVLSAKAAKPWYRSETVWGNAIAFLLIAIEANLHFLDGVLPGNVYQWAAFGVPLLNALMKLRDSHLLAPPQAEASIDPEAAE